MEEIGKILPHMLKAHVRRADPALVEILTPLWPRVVGKGIAQQTRPVAFASGTLTLATACPTWAAQLRQMAEEIRVQINSFLGTPVVKKLRVQHVPALSTGEATRAPRRSAPDLDIPSLPGSAIAAKLDPEIAGIVQRSFAKYFTRKRSKVH